MEVYIRNIVFACPDPRALASFYAELLGMRVIRDDMPIPPLIRSASAHRANKS